MASEGAVPPAEGIGRAGSAFAQRNPLLAKFIPDALEDAVDALLPDSFEARLEGKAQKAAKAYEKMTTDFNAGFGEVAAALLRVCKYALARFGIGDILFGVYTLAKHHAQSNAFDAIEGEPVTNPVLLKWLLYTVTLAVAAYCPTRKEMAAVAKCNEEDIVTFEPDTSPARPAYAIGVDHRARRIIMAFRGTTNLDDMLTDACASCVPYHTGFAHWGMLKAARWFVDNELSNVRELLDAHPGYGLLLCGHSLGAGTAVLLAHLIREGDPKARELMKGVRLQAVGIATPAVLTADMAEGCNAYISSVVLQHDLVPRFSIYNAFVLKEEMDATKWGDDLLRTAKDWAVPDVIEHSETYKRLTKQAKHKANNIFTQIAIWWIALMEHLLSLIRSMGFFKAHKAAAAAPTAAPAQNGCGAHADGTDPPSAKLRDVAAATRDAATFVMHHPGLAVETMKAIERACAEAAQGDVHAVYAPGRLFFLRRTDAPKEEQEARRKAAAERSAARAAKRADAAAKRQDTAAAADATSKQQAATAAAEAASVGGTAAVVGEQALSGAVGLDAGTRTAADGGVASAAVPAAEDSSDDEDNVLYPGATFELIRGSQAQRFKRIVLQETCLMDHLCGGYVQGVQQLLDRHGGADAGGGAPALSPRAT